MHGPSAGFHPEYEDEKPGAVTAGLRGQQNRSAGHYINDGPASRRLQATVALVGRTLGFPSAMINVLDASHQHTINRIGTGGPVMSPREEALCDLVVTTGMPLEVPDTGRDPRFAHLPVVARGDIGVYLGVPLTGRESFTIGALCVTDRHPCSIDPDVTSRLVEFGKIVEDQLDLLRRLDEQRVNGDVATAELAAAIRDEQIVPWYQPIIDLATGRTIGFEALARWQHPSGAMHDPSQFIPLAEDTDLIVELDLLVMRRASQDLRRWQQRQPDLRLSVNLSSQHFNLQDTAEVIHRTVLAAGISPATVDLEVTETTRLDPAGAVPVLGDLRDAGFGVWLDDFGTGWSALEYVLRLPITGVKIDRAVSIALGSRLGNALIRAVTGLATELDLVTTIEGIEKTEHATLAHELGCTYAQGYLWSKPIPASAADLMVAAR